MLRGDQYLFKNITEKLFSDHAFYNTVVRPTQQVYLFAITENFPVTMIATQIYHMPCQGILAQHQCIAVVGGGVAGLRRAH